MCIRDSNKEQRKTLNLWIEGERVIYNATLASVKKKEMPLDLSKLEAAFSTARTENPGEKRKHAPDASSSSTRNLRPKQKEVSSFGSDYIDGNAYDNALKDAAGPEDSDEKIRNRVPRPMLLLLLMFHKSNRSTAAGISLERRNG